MQGEGGQLREVGEGEVRVKGEGGAAKLQNLKTLFIVVVMKIILVGPGSRIESQPQQKHQ